jgi:hypothetical protein
MYAMAKIGDFFPFRGEARRTVFPVLHPMGGIG